MLKGGVSEPRNKSIIIPFHYKVFIFTFELDVTTYFEKENSLKGGFISM